MSTAKERKTGTRRPEPSSAHGRATADDVARAAGVSVITVRRVFRDSSAVIEDTRRQVLAAARAVGYNPSFHARALSTGKTRTVAVVQAGHQTLRGDYNAEIICGIQRELFTARLDILLSVVPETDSSSEWSARMVSENRCDAIAVMFDRPNQVDARELSKIRAPIVLLNHIPPPAERKLVSSVGFDTGGGTTQAVRYLTSIGHKDIAFVGGTPDWPDAIEREQAFLRAMANARLKVHPEKTARCFLLGGEQNAAIAMDAIFSRSNHPTAVVCAHDELARGVYLSARRWGKQIPRDLSVTGHYDAPSSDFITPPLTTVRQLGYDLGLKAGQLLVSMITGEHTRPETVIIPTELIIRESTAPPG